MLNCILVDAMKKVEAIKNKRQTAYMMQRLRKGKEIEDRRDIREVQRDLSLIRAPHAGESTVLQHYALKNFNFSSKHFLVSNYP